MSTPPQDPRSSVTRLGLADRGVPVIAAPGGLTLEPLRVDHAAEMATVLDDVRLHTYTGGSPCSEARLRRTYERQVRGGPDDGREVWLNWVVRDDATGRPIGYVQATVTVTDDDRRGPLAHLAWVVGVEHQGRGVASRSAAAVVGWLGGQGVTAHVADVHPEHIASQAVARRLGLRRTEEVVDGEVRWVSG